MSTQLLYIRDTWDVYTISKSMVSLRYHNVSTSGCRLSGVLLAVL